MSAPQQADRTDLAAVSALVAAQAAARAAATRQAVAMATAAVLGFAGWYDTAQITAWAVGLAKRIETFQRLQAQQTDAYLARALSMLTGGKVRPVGRVDVASLRQGVTHAGAYGRVADVYRWQQAQFDKSARSLVTDPAPQPFTLVDPMQAAVDRAASVAETDIQLADRAQAQQTLTAGKAETRGYRRVIHPELSKGGTCGLCIASSDRVYHVNDLMPIHGHCECTVLPIVGQQDPGSGLNNLDLQTLYGDAGATRGRGRSTSGKDLKRTRYQIDEHGELGPVLNPAGVNPRTARDARRDANNGGRAKTPAERRADAQRVRDSLMLALPKAHDLTDGDPKTWGDYLAKLEARIAELDQQLAD